MYLVVAVVAALSRPTVVGMPFRQVRFRRIAYLDWSEPETSGRILAWIGQYGDGSERQLALLDICWSIFSSLNICVF